MSGDRLLYRYVTSPCVRVLVGPASHQQEFFVHQSLICGRSEFFSNAMSGHWKETVNREVPLPEDEPDIFALYLKLLYVSAVNFNKHL